MKKTINFIFFIFLVPVITLLSGAAPSNLSLQGIVTWTEAGGGIASGTGALPSVASEGTLYWDISTPNAPLLYRVTSGSWVAASQPGSGTSDETALNNHIASKTDPHGASETITSTLTIGSGLADTDIYRVGTGTVAIASFVCILPMAATPTGVIATGTHFYDASDNTEKVWNGSAWKSLW